MDYKKIKCSEYTIHFLKTKRFHTIDFSIIFTENVNKRKITYCNTLINVMSYCTKKYDTNQKLIRKCQDLYSIKPIMYNMRLGNLLKTKFNISIVDSKYIDEQNIFENMLLLKEVILNPYVNELCFDDEKLALAKKQVITDLELIKESPRTYANYMALKLLGDDVNYNLTNYVDENILKEITSKNLYEYYLEMLRHSKIDIMISGNIRNEEEIASFIKDNFYFNHVDINLNNSYAHHEKTLQEPVKEKETRHLTQSKLSMIYKVCDVSTYENKYVLGVFNSIFGGNSNCLLINLIREKHSLCYYANSYFNKLDNIIVVNSGIDAENYEKVLDLVHNALIKMQKGEFTKEDIKTAKLSILDDLDSFVNSNHGLIEYQYGLEIFKGDDIEIRKQKIKDVSKKDIMELAKKVNLSSVFFLKGDL